MRRKILTGMFSIGSLLAVVLGCAETPKPPEWQKAQVLAEKLDHPSAITADDTSIYYVTGGTVASLREGTSGVWKMPLAGGAPTQLFKGVQKDERTAILPDTFVLATDEKYVYWSSGSIWRTPKDGGESEKITTGMPTKMVLDESKIYWKNFAGENSPPAPIYWVAKTGGEGKALTEPLVAQGIAVDKDFLYWAVWDGIYKMPKNGGEKSKVYSAPEKRQLRGFIVAHDNFYFIQDEGRNALMKLSKKGGEPVKLASEINHAHPFYADETHIYFIKNEGSFGTSLNKVASSGGEIVQLDSGYLRSFTVAKTKSLSPIFQKFTRLPNNRILRCGFLAVNKVHSAFELETL
jgi:hypothetical protein